MIPLNDQESVTLAKGDGLPEGPECPGCNGAGWCWPERTGPAGGLTTCRLV